MVRRDKIEGYIPDRGDLVWLQFNPQAGHEQKGRRPALVISPKAYNEKVGLALFCPVTSVVKGYPFEVLMPKGIGVEGAILSDQIKSLDWKARRAEMFTSVSAGIMEEVLGMIGVLVGK